MRVVQERISSLAIEANRAYEAYDAARLQQPDTHVAGVQLKKGEVAYLTMEGIGLVEPRRDPGHWVGASHGVSFKIAKGMRYHVGQTRGTFQQGEERPQVIDTGLGVITNQRMVFVGSKRTTEWAFSKLVGFSLADDGVAIFNVSNRQKASGFAYQPQVDHIVDAVVTAAIGQYQGPADHAAVVEELAGIYRDAYAAWEHASTGEAAVPIAEQNPNWPPPTV
ncbi:MAG TPA: hypothetical protein VGC84_15575 [Ilumatobacteraceae bacterium]|jgi:hypothetical protein